MAYIGASGAATNQATVTDVFNGNGSNTQFTLSRTVFNNRDIAVVVNNVQQNPFDGSYSVSGQTLTFTGAPSSGANNIYVNYKAGVIGLLSPTDNSVTANTIQSGAVTSAKLALTTLAAGNTTLTGSLYVSNTSTHTGAATFANTVTVANSGIAFGDASVQSTAATGFGFKNRIINGDMRIDQRNAGATLTSAADGSWAVDRWVCYHNIATVNIGQNLNSVASINGIPNQLGIQITSPATATSTQYTNFQHYIEGFNTADLAWGTSSAQPITISFWVRSSLTGTQGFALQNAGSALGYPFPVTINSANTWEYKTVTIAGPTTGTWNTTNGRGITLIVDLGMGSSFRFASGSWQAGNVQGVTGANSLNQTSGATFYITGVQLEKGSTATSFDYRPYGTELALCQRYYQQIGNSSYAGIANALLNNLRDVSRTVIKPIVDMRSAPTVNFSNIITTDRTGFDTEITSTSGLASSTNSVYVNFHHAVSGTAYYPVIIAVKNGTTGYVSLNAEL